MKVDWFRRIPFSFGISIPLHDNPSSISAVYQIVEGFVVLFIGFCFVEFGPIKPFLPRYPMHPTPNTTQDCD